MSAVLSDYFHAGQNRISEYQQVGQKKGTPSGSALADPEVHVLNETAFIFLRS